MNTKQAVLLLAYGTPTTAADIEAYYTDIRHGRPPEKEQLEELQDRYNAIGGRTPLTDITLEQAKLLEKRIGIPTYVGMKHWTPYIPDAIKQITKRGAHHIIALVLAPHYSILSIGDYQKRLEKAVSEINPDLQITMIKQWGNNPVFIDSLCQRITQMKKTFPQPTWNEIEVVFTAHSLPMKILAMHDPYQKELLQTSTLAAKQLKLPQWRLSFQSAGRTRDTWLGPDILQELRAMKKEGKKQVLVAPIGFTTDNLEILYDLDIQATELAQELGITFKRIPSANATPQFIAALQDVVEPYLHREHILSGANPES